jgi:hypothetical protein
MVANRRRAISFFCGAVPRFVAREQVGIRASLSKMTRVKWSAKSRTCCALLGIL